jgi:hypothetical protein
MHRARAELNAQSDSNEHPTNMGYKPKPDILGATLPGRCLRTSYPNTVVWLYGDLPSHNNAYVFFDHSVLQRRKGREVARSEEESRRKAV